MNSIRKYPSTQHVAGSGLQRGDSHETVSEAELYSLGREGGVSFVYEEKLDGANSGFSFDGGGSPMLQSRGHYLDLDRSVFRERHFNGFKDWVTAHADALLERFEDRYLPYGEWLGVTHSVFYDRLPHLFMEFDIFDRAIDDFLDTPTRAELCEGLPIASVPVLYRGPFQGLAHLRSFVRPSLFQSPRWKMSLVEACALLEDDAGRRLAKMDRSGMSEGLYIKVERAGRTVGRLKYVRPDFVQVMLDADEHWQSRFPVPNLLAHPVDIFPMHLVAGQHEPVDYRADAPDEWAAAMAARNEVPS